MGTYISQMRDKNLINSQNFSNNFNEELSHLLTDSERKKKTAGTASGSQQRYAVSQTSGI